MSDYKYRFIKLMCNHSPIKRSDLTRRTLAQLRIDMGLYKVMLTRCKNQGLISCKKAPILGAGGVVPEIYFLTNKGKAWLRDKDK